MGLTLISTSTTVPQTVDYICREILYGSTTDIIKSLVQSTSQCPDPVKAAFDWIWYNISYYPDPVDQQILKVVDRIIDTGIANCANYCIIMGAYLYAMGYNFSLRVASYNKDRSPEHIYIMWQGIPLDLTAGQYLDKYTGMVCRTHPIFAYQFPNPTYIKDFAFYPMATIRNINGKGRVNFYRQWLLH